MVAPSIQNVAGFKELIAYIDRNSAASKTVVVSNTTGSTIAKGTVVYLSGATGNLPSIEKAKANSQTTLPGFGVLQSDILTGTTGGCQFAGLLNGIDTSGFAAGNLLFVSEMTAGVLTVTEPPHPGMSQLIALVTEADSVNGELFIFPCFTPHGQEIGTISDTFKIGAATAGAKILKFVSSFIGSLSWTPSAARTLTLPDATDTLIGKATTDVLTNKTLNSAGTGNVLQLNGVTVPAPYALGAAATDAPTTQTLANNCRAALIAAGLGS